MSGGPDQITIMFGAGDKAAIDFPHLTPQMISHHGTTNMLGRHERHAGIFSGRAIVAS
jgi:hypothetical protein